MNAFDPSQPAGTHDRLAEIHAAMSSTLKGLLDVEAGLREVLVAAHHSSLTNDLIKTLHITAGVHAIAPVPAPPKADPSAEPAPIEGEVARLLTLLDVPTRLAIRNHHAFDALAVVFTLHTALDLAGDLATHIEGSDIRPALDAVRALTDVLGNDTTAGTLYAEIGPDDHPADLVHDLLSALADHAIARALIIAPQLVRALERAFARAVAFARKSSRGMGVALRRAVDLDIDLDRAVDRARHLARARHDFTTADLRGIDLTGIRLDGLRWSAATTWPSEDWRSKAVLVSAEIEPGIYEIRGGTTNVPSHIA
jgi:hypothetical protein